MSPKLFVLAGLLAVAWPHRAAAEAAPAPADDSLPSPATDQAAEIARLRALPSSHIPLKAATLASAIRLLAQTAHMSYIAPAESEFAERVTSDVMMNPYDLLEVLGDNYGFGLEYKRGVWRFYRVNLNELVSKSYTIRYNNLRQVTITSSSINGQLASAGGMGMGGGMMGGMGGGMSGGMGGGGGANAAGGANRGTFNVKPDKIIDDIKKILGFPTVGLSTPALDGSSAVPGSGADRKPEQAPKVEPIWNPETSQLFVVATRQQHSLIAAYLKTVDRPQKLVRIAVKFVETSRNPQQALGVDWSQTFLGSGGPITLGGASVLNATNSTTTSGGANPGTVTTLNTASGIASGAATGSTTTNPFATGVNLGHYFPSALLSAPAFSWTVQAIQSDKYSSIVQDPVIYTTNNREVSFKSTTQEPVQQGTTTIGSATAATSTEIAYIDVGTVVSILPCILPGDGPHHELIQLNLSIDVSAIIGTQSIGGNPYPVTSSRTYSYSVSLPVGETLAIAGLEERTRQTNDSKVPIFGDIPLLGYAFKNTNDSVIHTTLLAFITPELVQTDGAEETTAVPILSHRVFEGAKDETLAEATRSLKGIPADIALLVEASNRANKSAILNRLDLMEVELSLIDVRLGELRLSGRLVKPDANLLESDRRELAQARADVSRLAAD